MRRFEVEWKCEGVSDLDEGVIEQRAGGPAAFGLALQAVAQEVLPLRAQLLWDLRLVAHPHFVHDLEVMLVLVPRPLCRGFRNSRKRYNQPPIFQEFTADSQNFVKTFS